MNQSKFEAAHRGMTAQAKRVYDVIPIAQAWSPAQVMSELHRRNLSMSDKHVVMGCINSLIDSGVVVEVTRGAFKRTEVKPKHLPKEPPTQQLEIINQDADVKPIPDTPARSAPAAIGPLDRLSAFAVRLRDLAKDMEDAAIELAGQAEKNEAETAKMRQLQALLKSLG